MALAILFSVASCMPVPPDGGPPRSPDLPPPDEPRPPAEERLRAPSAEERALHASINDRRRSAGLPAIGLSKSLSLVAQTHARDLQVNPPAEPCNLHSWSPDGPWTPCCYTPDHAEAECMWSKPRELSEYGGTGYEIAFWHSRRATAGEALASWERSAGHSAVVFNRDRWAGHAWRSLGVAIHGNFAVAWFGDERDPAGYWE